MDLLTKVKNLYDMLDEDDKRDDTDMYFVAMEDIKDSVRGILDDLYKEGE